LITREYLEEVIQNHLSEALVDFKLYDDVQYFSSYTGEQSGLRFDKLYNFIQIFLYGLVQPTKPNLTYSRLAEWTQLRETDLKEEHLNYLGTPRESLSGVGKGKQTGTENAELSMEMCVEVLEVSIRNRIVSLHEAGVRFEDGPVVNLEQYEEVAKDPRFASLNWRWRLSSSIPAFEIMKGIPKKMATDLEGKCDKAFVADYESAARDQGYRDLGRRSLFMSYNIFKLYCVANMIRV
jgi:hypothetical protein